MADAGKPVSAKGKRPDLNSSSQIIEKRNPYQQPATSFLKAGSCEKVMAKRVCRGNPENANISANQMDAMDDQTDSNMSPKNMAANSGSEES